MNESRRMADQLRRAFAGEAWHGSSLKEILDDVDAKRAAARPLPSAHSIWEIVLHLSATHELVHRRLHHDATPLTAEEDWPIVADTGGDAWRNTCDALAAGHTRVTAALAAVDAARLNEPIVPGGSSIYVTGHGLVQHDLYHAGQIALLAKA